jgi:hypothetical protein
VTEPDTWVICAGRCLTMLQVNPASIVGTCAACAASVWLDPKSQHLIARHPATRVECMECFMLRPDAREFFTKALVAHQASRIQGPS